MNFRLAVKGNSMEIGNKIGGYELLKSCGKGTFGEVFLASDLTGRRVALKVIKTGAYSADRELKALRDYIKCIPNEFLMSILHAEQQDGFFFYAMDLADNLEDTEDHYTADTLQKRLERNGAFSVKETTDLAIQLLRGIKVLHDHGLVHRDIKPANILWIGGQAKLGDIGLLARDNCMTCQAGTPGFMPPSNFGIGVNSPQVDLYALAQVLYRCLTGQRDTGLDDLELTDDLQKNGAVLFTTIDLVCQKNSPIKTADQFLESLVRPSEPAVIKAAGRKKVTSTQRAKRQSHHPSSPIPDYEESLEVEDDIDNMEHDVYPENYNNGTSTLWKVAKWGLPMLGVLVPGGALVKGAVAGSGFLAKHLIDSLEKDDEIDDLRSRVRLLEHQKRMLLDREREENDSTPKMEDDDEA